MNTIFLSHCVLFHASHQLVTNACLPTHHRNLNILLLCSYVTHDTDYLQRLSRYTTTDHVMSCNESHRIVINPCAVLYVILGTQF